MNDLNWKTLALLFIVAIGFIFEGIKRLPRDTAKWTIENFKLADDAEQRPYQVKHRRAQAPRMMPMPQVPRVAGASVVGNGLAQAAPAPTGPTQTSEFGHVEKPGEGKDAKKLKKKKKNDEEYEYFIDPRTGKRYRRKKKTVAKVETPPVETAKEESKPEESKEEDIDTILHEAIATGSLPPVGNKADTPHADLEEWKRRLLTRPDPAETRRFIEHYQNGLVSAEIYYKIVYMMIEDSRPQMKELGVLCAGLTPSALSFQALADVLKTERSGSSLRKYTDSFLARYADLGNLRYLDSVLRAPASSFVTVQAIQRVDESAKIHLAPAKNKNQARDTQSANTNTPASTATTTTRLHSNASYYKNFVPLLTSLARNPDANVKDLAAQTLASLNRLMNVGATPSTTTTPPQVNLPTQASSQPL